MASDNTQGLLDEYLELCGKLMEDYTLKLLQCGDNTSEAKELTDKYKAESQRLFDDYLAKRMKSFGRKLNK